MNSRPNQSLQLNAARLPRALLAILLLSLISQPRVRSQAYMFTTLAGSGGTGAVDGPSAIARFNHPQGVTVEKSGNIYVADSFNSTIRKVAADGSVTTLAGLATFIGSDNSTGAAARFNFPTSLAADGNGNIYVADDNNQVIRKITPGGVVSTFAGSPGVSGTDDGPAANARFAYPVAVAVDGTGNLYVADQLNHAIRKITPDGTVSTVAGSLGHAGSDDGVGTFARFNYPSGIATFGDIIYVADSGNHIIRKITADGTVITFAGSPAQNGSDDGLADAARFFAPVGLTTDSLGNIYVADTGNSTIRKITPDGDVTTLAGDPAQPDLSARPFVSYADGLGNVARFKYPYGVAADGAGNIFVADTGNDAVRRITSEGLASTIAGSSQPGTNDGPGALARLNHPSGVAVGKSGEVFVVDGVNNTIRKIDRAGLVTTLAGSPGQSGSDDGIGSSARFNGPRKLALDSAGNLFVADTANSTIRKLATTNSAGPETWRVSTFAGLAGSPGSDNGQGSAARFRAPYDVAIDHTDNLYIADKDNHVIRKITPDGVVTTYAGTVGVGGWADGTGDTAQFNLPYGIAIDGAGFVYVADTLNNVIRRISPTRVVTTLAGRAGTFGNNDGPGDSAHFNAPYGVAVDAAANIYVADYLSDLIRKVTPGGFVTTIGGQAQPAPDGTILWGSADGPGLAARFRNPKGIAADSNGTIYIAEGENNTVRMGTTNFCPDVAIIDQQVARVGQQRQLDTTPRTAVAWQWSLIRRPSNSHATLSAENIRNPAFTPDVLDTFIFQLRATNAAGAIGVRRLALVVTPPPPAILTSSLSLTNGQFSFTFEGVTGATVQVQVSTNLFGWRTLGAFTNETGNFTIVDTGPNPQLAFYRLRQL